TLAGTLRSATAGGLDQLHEASRRLPIAVEVLGGASHPVGQPWCALLAPALDSEKDQPYGAGGNDQDDDHCDDDGGHDFLSDSQLRTCCGYVRGRNCLTGRTAVLRRSVAGSSFLDPFSRSGVVAGGVGGTALGLSLPTQDHNVEIERPILALDFIT